MYIPPKRHPATRQAKQGRPVVACKDDYQQRYKMERNFAWLGNFRRRLIRWEHDCAAYESFFTIAVMIVCLLRPS